MVVGVAVVYRILEFSRHGFETRYLLSFCVTFVFFFLFSIFFRINFGFDYSQGQGT